jgi:cytochrome c5
VAGTGAPLTGNSADWQDRLDQGMDILVQRVIEGYGGMPPLGMCFDCDEEQFTALVTFMVQPAN